jgi:hypothetical protein
MRTVGWRPFGPRGGLVGLVGLLGVLATATACSSPTAPSASTEGAGPEPQRARVRPAVFTGDDRNIARDDYIGPEACGECHAPEYERWQHSLHRVMNQRVDDPGAVIGTFAAGATSGAHRGAASEVFAAGATVTHRGGELRMERDVAGYTMTARTPERTTRYRITRTIGRARLQEYVGIEDGRSEEVRLPLGFWPRAGGWAVQSQFDPWLDASFDPLAPVRESWAERCPWCHSTYPFAQRIARTSGPRLVGHGLEQFFTTDAGEGGGTGADRLDVAAQVTTGISCESCHLGGRAHADGAPIQFLPRGATRRAEAPELPATFAEQRTNATVVNTVCAQCHSGPSPRLADGTALRNSSEALDLARSSCTDLKCTDCHDPHRADGTPNEARAVATCVRCHEAQQATAHAGRGHAKASCLDCHMPRVVMGVDRYVRTHRISSPTNPRLLADAAPNACNLCHLDRSIDWTLAELRAGWGVRLVPKLARTRDRDASAGDAWLASPSPAIRLIAAHAYARSPLGRFAVRDIERGLSDPLPYVRAWMRFALEEIARRR